MADRNRTETTAVWTYAAVKLLTEMYAEKRSLLDKSSYKKMDVYNIIASSLQDFGYNFTKHECASKMDNLLWKYVHNCM